MNIHGIGTFALIALFAVSALIAFVVIIFDLVSL